jgi:hypothetical protein
MRQYLELMEAMSYALLMEDRGRMEFLLKTYGQKLEQKYQLSGVREPPEIEKEIGSPFVRPDGDLPYARNLITYLSRFDPSHNQQFIQWMVLRYLKGQLRLEDTEAAKEYLSAFLEMKAHRQLQPNQTDINKYQTLADLRAVVQSAQQLAVQSTDQEEREMLKQAKVLYDKSDMRVLIPLTQAAACYFGRNTEWCTAWGDHQEMGLKNQGRHPGRSNRYDSYTRQGPLYIIELKPVMSPDNSQEAYPARIYQYHSETGQFADVNDQMLRLDAIQRLLTDHPNILRVVGAKQFAKSHLDELGVSFFPTDMLADIEPYDLASAIKKDSDYAHLPEAVQKDPAFLGEFLMRSETMANRVVPQEILHTPEVAAFLRGRVSDNTDLSSSLWRVFDGFPMREWPERAVEAAAETGRLTYQQYMQLPEDQRSTGQLQKLVTIIASKNPEIISTYPPGLITELGILGDILKRNIQVAESLSHEDLNQESLIVIAGVGDHDVFDSYEHRFGLAYFPPEIITDEAIDLINENSRQIPMKKGDELQKQLRQHWVGTVVAKDFGTFQNMRNADTALAQFLKKIPKRYKDDPTFFEEVFEYLTKAHRDKRNGQLWNFLLTFSDRVTPKMLTELVHAVLLNDERSGHGRAPSYIAHGSVRDWTALIKQYFAESMWTPDFAKAALSRKIMSPSDLPDALRITPSVAARIFYLYPDQTAMAFKADDASLIAEIKSGHFYGAYGQPSMLNSIPKERITEPVAFAMVQKATIPDAKKKFPRKALSKRVYHEAVPYSISLNQVPKAARTDAVEVRAVARNYAQLKYIPEPVQWLNDHVDLIVSAVKQRETPANWMWSIQGLGIIATGKGFAYIHDLPHDDLESGYTLYKAELPKKEQRWFLEKDDQTAAVLTIKKGKLTLANEHPQKDLEKVFREIAARYLTGLSDIKVLNRIGIYQNPDGSIRDEDKARASLPRDTVEGIDWVTSPHLAGKLYTAWKDDTALVSIYYATAAGWGWRHRIRDMNIKDYKLARENAKALIPGLSKITRDPEGFQWQLIDIGIFWTKHIYYFPTMEHKIGSVGGFDFYYVPGQRFISVYKPSMEKTAAWAYLLKNGNFRGQHYAYNLDEETKKMLVKSMDALSGKIIERERAKK